MRGVGDAEILANLMSMQRRVNPDAYAAFERLGADPFLSWARLGASDAGRTG